MLFVPKLTLTHTPHKTEAHLASTSAGSSSILGCYEAPAKLREDKPSAPCVRLAQRIAQRSSSPSASSSSNATAAAMAGRALVVVLNNQLLLSPTSDPFIASIHSSSSSNSSSSGGGGGGDSPGAQAQLPKGSITIAGADAAQAFSDASVVAAKLLQEGVAGRIADLDGECASQHRLAVLSRGKLIEVRAQPLTCSILPFAVIETWTRMCRPAADHLINPSLDWLQNKRLQTAIPRVA